MPEKTYTFIANTTVSLYTTVVAETLEEAIAIAKRRHPRGFCDQCGRSHGHDEKEWQIGGDIEIESPDDLDLVDLHVSDNPVTQHNEIWDKATELWYG